MMREDRLAADAGGAEGVAYHFNRGVGDGVSPPAAIQPRILSYLRRDCGGRWFRGNRPRFLLYQRVGEDCFPLSNGRKPSLRACKEDDSDSNGRIHHNYSTSFESKPLRARPAASGSVTPDSTVYALYADPVYSDHRPATRVADDFSRAPPVTRDVLPQWGQRKRTRISRPAAEEFSGSQSRKVFKIQKRMAAAASAAAASEKVAASSAMPPPGAAYVRGANLRPCTPIRDATSPPVINRSVEERSGGQGRPEKRSPPSPPPAKTHKRGSSGVESAGLIPAEPKLSADHDGVAEKVNPEPLEWPRIQISLSRKEKEEDFLAMKGTKLPQRPRKRPKTVERALQYVFPGMWLPDVTRSRYEVREKKCAKKKRRGLKGMDMDSESD